MKKLKVAFSTGGIAGFFCCLGFFVGLVGILPANSVFGAPLSRHGITTRVADSGSASLGGSDP